MLFQNFGRAQQHCGMGVVAAGVHGSGALGGKGQAGFFLHGQCVHVSSHQYAMAALFADIGHKGVGDHFPVFHAPFIQLLPHQSGGLGQVLPNLRMLVDLPPPGYDLLFDGTGLLKCVHNISSFCGYTFLFFKKNLQNGLFGMGHAGAGNAPHILHGFFRGAAQDAMAAVHG